MKKKSFFLTAVATLSLATATIAQTVPNYVPTNGLVGWWPFNGNANDESGNGNNGTVNGATLTTDRNNTANKSYFFTTDNWSPGSRLTEIYIPYSSNLTSSNITVMAWINPATYGWPGSSASILKRFEQGYSNPNGETWGIELDANNTGKIQSFVIGSVPNNNQPLYVTSIGNTLPLNGWSLVGFSFDGSNLKTFVNGVLQNTTNAPQGFQINTLGTSGISIGVSNQANGYWSPYKGKIDDIGIWNRALTQQEITDLYNANICYQTITVTDTLIINTNLVGFNPVTYQNSIKIYPNPTNDHITINYGNFATLSGYQLKIENSLGQQVFQTNINQQSSYLNLSTWGGNGIYFVRIIDPQGNTVDIRKIVLQ